MRTFHSMFLSAGLVALVGCPQPPDTPDNVPSGPGAPPTNAPPPVQPSAPDGGGEPGGDPPAAPDGAAPEAPPEADAPGEPGGGAPCDWSGVEEQWSQYKGKELIQLTGDIVYEGDVEGNVIVDFLSAEKDILLGARCDKPGTFEVSVPKDLGAVTLVALIDVDYNGPTRNDIVGRVAEAVEVKGEDIDGVSITIAAGGDLGDITLPEPSGDAFPPTEGEIPPEEAKDMGVDGEPPAGEAPAPPNPYKQTPG